MQTSVPELTEFRRSRRKSSKCTAPSRARRPIANNCLLARRLAERGVRFIQLCHRDWDHHGGLPDGIKTQAKNTDQASAALIKDLKQRGLLDETLVIWGGEFGRTAYSQGEITKDSFGRDHHPRCFSIWMAGGGIKPGLVYRQDRRFRLQHRRKPGARPRSPRHDAPLASASITKTHLSLRRPRLPPDRYRRKLRPGYSCIADSNQDGKNSFARRDFEGEAQRKTRVGPCFTVSPAKMKLAFELLCSIQTNSASRRSSFRGAHSGLLNSGQAHSQNSENTKMAL